MERELADEEAELLVSCICCLNLGLPRETFKLDRKEGKVPHPYLFFFPSFVSLLYIIFSLSLSRISATALLDGSKTDQQTFRIADLRSR